MKDGKKGKFGIYKKKKLESGYDKKVMSCLLGSLVTSLRLLHA